MILNAPQGASRWQWLASDSHDGDGGPELSSTLQHQGNKLEVGEKVIERTEEMEEMRVIWRAQNDGIKAKCGAGRAHKQVLIKSCNDNLTYLFFLGNADPQHRSSTSILSIGPWHWLPGTGLLSRVAIFSIDIQQLASSQSVDPQHQAPEWSVDPQCQSLLLILGLDPKHQSSTGVLSREVPNRKGSPDGHI